jgi:hypothetical protein
MTEKARPGAIPWPQITTSRRSDCFGLRASGRGHDTKLDAIALARQPDTQPDTIALQSCTPIYNTCRRLDARDASIVRCTRLGILQLLGGHEFGILQLVGKKCG